MGILSKVASVLPGGGDDKDHYLALLITYQGVEVVLWRIEANKVVTVSMGKSTFASSGNILEATAEAIDQACEPVDIDAKDVILGLPDQWISKNQILPQYFDKLKDLARDLDITPFAFVSQNHAMINRLRLQHGTTLAGFLLNIDDQNCTLSSINGGQLVETRYVHIDDHNNNQAIQKLFAYFALTPQSAQTIYAVGESNDLDDMLSTLPAFGQLKPEIIHLPQTYPILAIALAGAVDRGNASGIHIEGEVADIAEVPTRVEDPLDSAVIATAESNPSQTPHDVAENEIALPSEADSAFRNDETKEASLETVVPPRGPNQGGLQEHASEGNDDQAQENLEPATNLPEGFVLHDGLAFDQTRHGEAASETQPSAPLRAVPERAVVAPQPLPAYQRSLPPTAPINSIANNEATVSYAQQRTVVRGKIPVLPIGLLLHKLKSIGKAKQLVHLPRVRRGKTGVVITGMVILILAIGSTVVAAALLTKATITLTLSQKTVEDDQQITVSSKAGSVDPSKNLIPATTQVSEVTGELKGNATGKKKVGEKARGTVTIYNKTGQAKSFGAGTVLVANNLAFTLDSSVIVPPRTATESASRDITIKPGKATASVIASDIGPESNIAASTDLLVKGQAKDTFDASVATNLSGGTAKDVTVISEADIKKAQTALATNLKEQAKSALLQKVTGSAKVIDPSLRIASVKQVVSKKAQDEAESFVVSQTVKAQALVYSLDDVRAIIEPLAKQKASDNLSLVSFDVTEPAIKNTEKNGDAILVAHYQAKLIPVIDSNKLAPTLVGKSVAQAKSQVLGISFVNDAVVTTKPSFIGKFNRLPFTASHITVTIKTP